MKKSKVALYVPRRAKGSRGRRPPLWPDLNFRRIADQVGISSTFLGRIMNGRVRPSIETAQKLAKYLGWPLEKVAALYSRDLKKFPYQKQEQSDGKGIKRAGGRGAQPAGTQPAGTDTAGKARKRNYAASVGNRSDKRKPKRKARPAAA